MIMHNDRSGNRERSWMRYITRHRAHMLVPPQPVGVNLAWLAIRQNVQPSSLRDNILAIIRRWDYEWHDTRWILKDFRYTNNKIE